MTYETFLILTVASPKTASASPPKAPKRFRTSYILFAAQKSAEVRQESQRQGKAVQVSPMNLHAIGVAQIVQTGVISTFVSQTWKTLSARERAFWDGEARKDKRRFENETARFWEVVDAQDAGCLVPPKKPCSAFLEFSRTRRRELHRLNPGKDNGQISKLLSKEWRNLDPNVKRPFLEEYDRKIDKYKQEMLPFRDKKPKGRKRNVSSESNEPSNASKKLHGSSQQGHMPASIPTAGLHQSTMVPASRAGSMSGMLPLAPCLPMSLWNPPVQPSHPQPIQGYLQNMLIRHQQQQPLLLTQTPSQGTTRQHTVASDTALPTLNLDSQRFNASATSNHTPEEGNHLSLSSSHDPLMLPVSESIFDDE